MAHSETEVPLQSLLVSSSNRVRIPKEVREEHGIARRQLLTVRFEFEDGPEEVRFPVGAKGDLTIPADMREEHDVEPGDRIEMTLLLDQ